MSSDQHFDLVYYPNPVLTKSAVHLNPDTTPSEKLIEIFDGMEEIMKKHDGVGIAAPQVGLSLRLFIAVNPETEQSERFVNPVISFKKTAIIQSETEGCLSLPNIQVQVQRPSILERVDYLDPYYQEKSISRVSGDFARRIQHEYDHLNGMLIIDKLSKKNRREALNRLKK